MTPLASLQYVQLNQIDDTAERIAYMLIIRYRSKNIDGISKMKSRLFTAQLKHYGLLSAILVCYLISFVSTFMFDSRLVSGALVMMGVLALAGMYFGKTSESVRIYKHMLRMQLYSYELIDDALSLPTPSQNDNGIPERTCTLCDQLNSVEIFVKETVELIEKSFEELVRVYQSQTLRA